DPDGARFLRRGVAALPAQRPRRRVEPGRRPRRDRRRAARAEGLRLEPDLSRGPLPPGGSRPRRAAIDEVPLLPENSLMAPRNDGRFEIVCPCCDTRLVVDAATGVILSEERPKKVPLKSFDQALTEVKGARE